MKQPSLSTLLKPFLFLLIIRLTYVANSDNDTLCLWNLKHSISDPNGYLNSWDFNNSIQGFICEFTGINCWNREENRVLNIRLANMGLKGHFPSGLDLCKSLTGLDLSNNSFTGPIPDNISTMVPFMTSFDLSFNSFSGAIPVNLSLCQYLNTINLQHNLLRGEIPGQLGTLDRLTTFNVANNLLSGQIPRFKNLISADNFANNPELCGSPLIVNCAASSNKSNPGVIIAIVVVVIVVVVLVVGVVVFVLLRKMPKRKREEDPKGNKWAKVLKGAKATKVLL